MSVTLFLTWDYDTATGFDVSHQSREADPLAEYHCTDRILGLLADHNIVSTFACVGKAAEPGPLPYHNPAQIRAIHAAGHEIASHSHRHELLPALSREQLHETLRRSKAALEDCIGDEVVGFVPPWNRPFHHPQRGSISLRDWRDGGGRWRHSVASLCGDLRECGYRWLRMASGNIWSGLKKRLGIERPRQPRLLSPACYHDVIALPNGYFAYDQPLLDWLAERPSLEHPLVLYAHPHGIEHQNQQNWQHLVAFAEWVSANAERCGVTFSTPRAWLEQSSGE